MGGPPKFENRLDAGNRLFVQCEYDRKFHVFTTEELAFLYYACKHHGLNLTETLKVFRKLTNNNNLGLSDYVIDHVLRHIGGGPEKAKNVGELNYWQLVMSKNDWTRDMVKHYLDPSQHPKPPIENCPFNRDDVYSTRPVTPPPAPPKGRVYGVWEPLPNGPRTLEFCNRDVPTGPWEGGSGSSSQR